MNKPVLDTKTEFLKKETSFYSGKLVTFLCEYSIEDFSDELFTLLHESIPESILSSVKKRKAEFLAGRLMAQKVLRHLNSTSTHVGIGKQRNPIWPDGFIGSITHNNDTAICLAGLESELKYIGIDIENLIESNMVEEIKSTIISPKEEVTLRKANLNFPKAFTLAFSAKESLFKALYSTVGDFFDFSAAEVCYFSIEDSFLELVLLQDLHPQLCAGRKFKAYFRTINDCVYTYIIE
ncbi:4'-phosphopantetheinyl transferase superfamily protein [Aliikangiella marina]|uniref:Enterobactin synthase component D n=1 Tax=Aliikangiella marina TaxID=1712262 RepID=A0A545TJG3_9GAMM|nr:4'-phosphopantetheinyl transferase superfamily protein [Aliikangiella marina]TQV77353.1 4'-phosphopantetheinyl transferase superfamily protein [Aliikangiella marina]